jgi:hypothetical protein
MVIVVSPVDDDRIALFLKKGNGLVTCCYSFSFSSGSQTQPKPPQPKHVSPHGPTPLPNLDFDE